MNRRSFVSLAACSPLAVLATLKASEEPVRLTIPKQPERVPAVDFEALLWSIAQVETGDRDSVRGPKGERSRYGITETVWKQYCSYPPFSRCRGAQAEFTARLHMAWLDDNVPRRTISEIHFRPYVLAWAWHGGLSSWTNYVKNKYPVDRQLHSYAERVHSLYRERTAAKPA